MITIKFYPDPNDDDLYEIHRDILRFSWIIEKLKEKLEQAGYSVETVYNHAGGDSCYHELHHINTYQLPVLEKFLEGQDSVYSTTVKKLTYRDSNNNDVTNPGLLVRLG